MKFMSEWTYARISSPSGQRIEMSHHLHAPVALTPKKDLAVPIEEVAEWASEPV